jgi:hypothetical protein
MPETARALVEGAFGDKTHRRVPRRSYLVAKGTLLSVIEKEGKVLYEQR